MAQPLSPFQPATKQGAYAKVAISGPSGSGKSHLALTLATLLGPRIAVRDSEKGSARKLSDRWQFDLTEPDDHSVKSYLNAIAMGVWYGYDVVILDTISHEWMGQGGILEEVDKARSANPKETFAAWRDATPKHNAFLAGVVRAPIHLIATMRSKTEWVVEAGKPRKIGTAPVQRDGTEYEFDLWLSLDPNHRATVEKSRCPALDGYQGPFGEAQLKALTEWLGSPAPREPITWHDEVAGLPAQPALTWTQLVFGSSEIKLPPATTGTARWMQLLKWKEQQPEQPLRGRLDQVIEVIRLLS